MQEDLNSSKNSSSESSIIQVFNNATDPRSGTSLNYRHPLSTILFITVVCSLCGSNDWETIVVQANAMKDWLACFVDVSRRIPCSRTFIRVFNTLNPKELNKVLSRVAKDIGIKENKEIISFDSKAMKGTSASHKGLKAIHMLNSWSHEYSKKTASNALELGADYVLPIKGNQPDLFADVDLLFKDAEKHDFRGFDADTGGKSLNSQMKAIFFPVHAFVPC